MLAAVRELQAAKAAAELDHSIVEVVREPRAVKAVLLREPVVVDNLVADETDLVLDLEPVQPIRLWAL